MQQISALTNGKFYRVTDEATLENVYKEINQLEKTDIKATEKIHYEEAFAGFLKLGLFLLFVEQLLARGWWRIVP